VGARARGEARNLTASLPQPPTAITVGATGVLLAIVGGDLWRLDLAGEPRNLTTALTATVRSVAARQARPVGGAPEAREFVISAGEGEKTSYFRVALEDEGAKIEELPRPSPHAKLEAHWPAQRTVVFKASETAASSLGRRTSPRAGRRASPRSTSTSPTSRQRAGC
jgi:hypothetical protein